MPHWSLQYIKICTKRPTFCTRHFHMHFPRSLRRFVSGHSVCWRVGSWDVVGSRKVSKPRDWYFELSYRFEIWQAHRQHCCRSACQISERSNNSKYKSRGFETLRDLTERRLFGYWDGAQITPEEDNWPTFDTKVSFLCKTTILIKQQTYRYVCINCRYGSSSRAPSQYKDRLY